MGQHRRHDPPDFERRLNGTGPELDPLEWDVKTYFALNGAVHDAAIAAWGKRPMPPSGSGSTATPVSG